MQHDRAQALMREQFEEGTLAPHQVEALRIHLKECDACRAIYDRYADLESVLAGKAVAGVQVERLASREPPSSKVGGRVRPWVLRTLPIAIAASLVWFALFPRPGPLPAYELAFDGGEQSARSIERREVPSIRAESRLELTLRPDEPVEGPVEVRALLVKGGEVRPIALGWARSESGSLHATASGRDLGASPGRWTLLVAIGRNLPNEEEIASSSVSRSGIQILTQPIEIRAN